jgi:hypothetical protein
MKSTYTSLAQSRFFNPAFNSAIFDGPVRIYFAQSHESLALKIYFSLQQNFAAEMARAKDIHKDDGRNLLIMLYPSKDSFQMSFEDRKDFLVVDNLDGDEIIGINGPFEDEELSKVLQTVSEVLTNWRPGFAELPTEITA